MKNYYKIESNRLPEKYVTINEDSVSFIFKNACFMSEFQHIDTKEPVLISIDENSGDIFPDLLGHEGNGIVIISQRFKDILEDYGVDYVLFCKIILRRESIRNDHICWLMIPPKIQCLDYEKSKISAASRILRKAVIDERTTGRFDIFKIADKDGSVLTQKIIITEELKNHLEKIQQKEEFILRNVLISRL